MSPDMRLIRMDLAVPPVAPAVGTSDLSTILESETSGISKHVPNLDDSQDSHFEAATDFVCLVTNGSHPRYSPPLQPESQGSTPAAHDSPTTSLLDLSTSHLTSEVLEALSETKHRNGWLHTVVVDDTGDNPGEHKVAATSDIDPDSSFNLKTLDDDLAAVLNSKHLGYTDDPTIVPATSPTTPVHGGHRGTLMPPISLSSPPSPSALTFTSSNLSSGHKGASFRKIAAPNLPSSLVQQRLTRSASDRPSAARLAQTGLPPPLAHRAEGRAQSHSPERPSTASRLRPGDSTPQSRSPSPGFSRRPQTGNDIDSSRPSLSRLVTTSRTSERPLSSSLRTPFLRQLNGVSPVRSWDHDLSASTSRPPSSVSRAPSRLQHPRPSLDSSTDRPKPFRFRTRERSSSVTESRPSSSLASRQATSRNATDWLGPRATHALRTAASLSLDKEARAPSRFGSSRSSVDHDSRSRYTPSRMAFSEAGSSSSWGRRSESISRTPALSDAVSSPAMTESIATPRSVYSAGFAGPISTSGATPGLLSTHSELHQLQEKHSLETGVLLNALADSQRTTRVLREENTHLRERLQDLEDRLSSALAQLRRLQHVTPSSALSATSQQRCSVADLSTGPTHTHSPHHVYPSYRIPSDIPFSSETSVISPEVLSSNDPLSRTALKRHSASSSLFPVLPSNMTMLMQEEDIHDYAGEHLHRSASPSPTMVFSKLSNSPKRVSHHEPGHSISSSAGNISPTTANFSMVTGSPRSLNLRPEHERHLGDMASLELDPGDGGISIYNYNDS